MVIVAGNHDSPGHLEAPREILKVLGFHVVGAMPHSPTDALILLPNADSPRLAVAALPFLRDRDLRSGLSGQSAPEISHALVKGIRRRYDEVAAAASPWIERGIPLLATGHLTIVGSRSSDSEREIHVGGLGAITADSFAGAFSYVALGHLHRPQAAGGVETVRYAGSPIPLSLGEAPDEKEVRVLDFAGGSLVAHAALLVPLSRKLLQVRTTFESLDTALSQLDLPPCELPAWLEVIVDDPPPGENLYDRVKELVAQYDLELISVVREVWTSPSGMSADADAGVEGIDQLLGDPARVFEHRLAGETSLTDAERERLTTAFRELCELHAEQQRESIDEGVMVEQESGGS